MLQADYGRTLRTLARDGARAFYEGEIAERIAADFQAHGGFISRADLAGYRAEVAEPLESTYRGLRVVAPAPPAGGLPLLQMLNFLEGYDLGAAGWPSVEAARLRVEAMGWAFADRERHLADPRFAEVPVARLLDKAYAEEARRRTAAGERFAGRPPLEAPTTTHVCVVDGEGNAVSLTHTLGSSSGVVTEGLGFGYNNYLNCFDPRPGRVNSLAPGKTRITMMVPTIVFAGDRLRAVVGAPGGTKIVTAVLQTLLNVIDHGMTPVEAVSAPGRLPGGDRPGRGPGAGHGHRRAPRRRLRGEPPAAELRLVLRQRAADRRGRRRRPARRLRPAQGRRGRLFALES